MSFVKKVLPFAFAGFVVICVWTVYLRSNKPITPVKIYEVPQRTPRGESNTKPVIRQDTQTVETSERQASGTNESPVVSDTYLIDEFLDAGAVEDIDESEETDSYALDIEELSAIPQLSAEELRRQELLQRQVEIYDQLETIAPEGVTVHSSDDPEGVLRALELFKELSQIDEELSGYSSDNALRMIQRSINMTSSLNSDGKLPVVAAAKMAETWEQDGNFEAANRMHQVVRKAVESGDEVIKREHVEEVR